MPITREIVGRRTSAHRGAVRDEWGQLPRVPTDQELRLQLERVGSTSLSVELVQLAQLQDDRAQLAAREPVAGTKLVEFHPMRLPFPSSRVLGVSPWSAGEEAAF